MNMKFQRHFRVILLLAVLAGGVASGPASAVKQTGGEYNTLFAGLGAKGYDVVGYFVNGGPLPGSERHAFEYGGVTWRFATRENRDLFVADPARYAPQYGGFCAWGVSQGRLFDVDPVNGWKIVGGKLYLNFNADINSTFGRDSSGFIARASQNWPALKR